MSPPDNEVKGVSTGKNVVMASRGRAPWYTPDGKVVPAYVIGIAGGSSSGKTSVAKAIMSALDHIPTVLILSQDAFYKKHTQEEIEQAYNNDFDFDHPDSIDMDLFAECLDSLKHGRSTEIPVYSFVHHQRMPEKQYLYGASVIIVEGIMALQDSKMRDLYDLKVFVNCDSDLMLARRIRRDTAERGRDVLGILDQYLRFVKNSYDNFVQPSSRYADIIVPGSNNNTAIELLVSHIHRQLDARTLSFRRDLAKHAHHVVDDFDAEKHINLLPQTTQLIGIMTILRDERTPRSEFIFYTDRLATLIVEYALNFLPHSPKEIRTPTGVQHIGMGNCEKSIIGITILRSGGPFSHGLRRVIRDVPLGSMLIQSDPKTGEPLLLSTSLPDSLHSQTEAKTKQVFLLDSQMGTGAAALMAIRVLLDHGVPESNITILAFLVSRHAVATLHRTFPGVRIVTAALDTGLSELKISVQSLATPSGEGLSEGDFAARLVRSEVLEDISDQGQGKDSRQRHRQRQQRRRSGGESNEMEKVAWVVTPGMGHIGDRYYLA